MGDDFDPNSTGFIRQRTDVASRKIIDKLDSVLDDVSALKASTVRWDRLIFILGSAATVIVGASWKVMRDAVERGDRLQSEHNRAIDRQLEELRRQGAKAAGAYDVIVEKKPPREVAEAVRAVVADGGVK